MEKEKQRAAMAAGAGQSPSASVDALKRNFPKPDKNSILVCPVGGVGQIGMNFTLYGHDGKWVLVDAGSGFAPRDMDGVEAIFPDLRSLRDVIPQLSGLVITHAHEDHIGAIHRIFPKLRCPIYATPFASAVISNRLSERNIRGEVRIKTFKPGSTLQVGPFTIKTIRTTHSAPECVALAMKTPAGTVLHTGDWKFDPDPVLGKPTDISSLCSLGNEGVLAMVCDSTNADRRGKTTSERDVAEGMKRVFRKARGLVVVSCFSSNVARLASIAFAARTTGRTVALAGRSLINNEAAARQVGLLKGVPDMLTDTRRMRGLRRRQMVIVCTGSQGEGNAALSKYSLQAARHLPPILSTDTVVHSARVIPGNEEDVHELFDRLRAKNVTVIENEFQGRPVHVTGHATANEIARMYRFVRPRFAIPVHGEEHHLEAGAQIALKEGVERSLVPGEGDVLRVSQNGLEKVARVKIDLVAELSGYDAVTVPWDPKRPESVYDQMEMINSGIGLRVA